MMGVVLWSDPDDQKAVFWCEDHGDLAYYDSADHAPAKVGLLRPGDMVEFDVSLQRKYRRAMNARVVETQVCSGLHDHLRNTADVGMTETPRPDAANVVAIMPRHAQR